MEGNQEPGLGRAEEAETKTGRRAGEERGFQERPAQTEVEKRPKPMRKLETETHPDAHQRRGVRSGRRRPAGGDGASSLRGAGGEGRMQQVRENSGQAWGRSSVCLCRRDGCQSRSGTKEGGWGHTCWPPRSPEPVPYIGHSPSPPPTPLFLQSLDHHLQDH